eukprot:3955462-Pleurochrysis_carterae.AAC.2
MVRTKKWTVSFGIARSFFGSLYTMRMLPATMLSRVAISPRLCALLPRMSLAQPCARRQPPFLRVFLLGPRRRSDNSS